MNSQLLNLKIQVLLDEIKALEEEVEKLIKERADKCHHKVHKVHREGWFGVCEKCGASSSTVFYGGITGMTREELYEMRSRLTGPANLHGKYDLCER